jgi:leader peptidase (prepilin peptidase)/N-methyltransferase
MRYRSGWSVNLQLTDLPVWFLPLVAAPFAGSVLGVLIIRLPEGRPVFLTRSVCEQCGMRLTPRDLVPFASYVALRGRCRGCRQPIGWFHPAVEAAALGVAASAALTETDSMLLWIDCLLGWSLLALAWIDVRSMQLPDALTLPLLLGGLAATALLQPDAIGDHTIGAAAGYLLLRTVAASYRALRGHEGIGAGDAKLLGAAGAWLGWQALPALLLLAAGIGLGAAALMALSGRRVYRDTPLPFGPWLALAVWALWLHGNGWFAT